jgi:hypothetical protein
MQPAVGVLNNTRTVPEPKRLTIFAQPGGRPSSVTEITAGSAFHSAMVLGLLPREERVSSSAHIFSGGILSGLNILVGIARNYKNKNFLLLLAL